MPITRRIRKNSVPVIILAGFLGAGKTTIVNHVLRSAVGSKIAIIVNDFGDVNIDSLLITGHSEKKMELTNGCICCQVGDGELNETFEAITTGVNQPDAILIEASGLAEPEDIAKLVVMSSNQTIAYGGTVYAVDALNYQKTKQQHPTIIDHIKTADLIALTKVESVKEQSCTQLIDELRQYTSAPIVPVEQGKLSPSLLFDIPEQSDTQLSLLQQPHDHTHHHLHDEYQSVTFKTDQPLAPEKFKQMMNNLPTGVYRAKGILYFGINGLEQKFIMQAVGRRWDMYSDEWGRDETPRTEIVFIGHDFDKAAVKESAAATVGDSDEMLDFQRYRLR